MTGSTRASREQIVDRALARVDSGGRRVDRLVGRLVRLIVSPFRGVTHLWQRSIQARVVIGTLTLSALLVVLVGWILLRQVTDGLLSTKEQAALNQAASGFESAQSRLSAESFDIGPVLNSMIEVLGPLDPTDSDYGIVLVGPLAPTVEGAAPGGVRARGVDTGWSVPEAVLDAVVESGGSRWAYARVELDDQPSEPGIVVAAPITVENTGERYGLVYVFSLKEQQATLHVVRSALVTAGSLLVVLLGVVAWMVARQVVTPVRLARRIAERLAAGRLEERMHVRGQDDIARLGVSFNQMATSLQRQIRQLEELSRVQRRFVADVSHELRTPLTTVRMAADVLHDARQQFDGSTARSAELLQNELNRFELLLTDLLEISRFDAGAAVLDLADVDLHELTERVVDGCQTLADRRGAHIAVRAGRRPVLVEADPRRIERIVRNLVVNAIEYGEGSDVEVRIASDDQTAALSVRDRGQGLNPGEESLVFSRFWRADPARARTRGGTGLGLSIAVEDTVLHGGALEAWGRPGEGALFRLTLPRRAGGTLGPSPLPLEPPDSLRRIEVGYPYRTISSHREGLE